MLPALVLCLFFINSVYLHTYEDFSILLSKLFNETRYNKKMRPLLDQRQTVKVNVTQVLAAIESYDVRAGILKIQGFFQVSWYDELLVWVPNDYGGQTGFTLPKDIFWKPDITSAFGPSNDEVNIMDVDFAPANVISTGRMVMFPSGRYETICDVDTFYYPYDTHQCEFWLLVSNHLGTEVTLRWEENSLQTYYTFTDHPEWELGLIRNVENNITDITYNYVLTGISNRFYVSRRPNYEMVKTMIPLELLSFVNIVTFLIPPTCGERLSFSVSVFLALVFTSSAAMDDLPRNSLRLPLVSINIVIIDCIIAFSVMFNILVIEVTNVTSENLKLPDVLKKYLTRRKTRREMKKAIKTQSNRIQVESSTKDQNETVLNTEAILNNVKSQPDGFKSIEISGTDVACMLDTFFIIFATFVEFLLIVLKIVVLNARDEYK